MKRKILNMPAVLLCLLCGVLLQGCVGDRAEKAEKFDEVLIVYQAGYYPGSNDLSRYLAMNTRDFKSGYVPGKRSSRAMVLVSHLTSSYAPSKSPYVIRLYKTSSSGKMVLDTLKTFPETTVLTRPDDMSGVLDYVASNFKSDHYGMIFSSHGSGWLPEGYYNDPSRYEKDFSSGGDIVFFSRRKDRERVDGFVPDGEPFLPDGPMVRGAGMESSTEGGTARLYELELSELVSALPFKLDYIIFDACLMGGVETAWQLRNSCRFVLFSQAEILADGMYYPNMGKNLLYGPAPDLETVASEYYEHYEGLSGWDKSATISLVDCGAMEPLAEVCRTLFEKYREPISTLKASSVQGFFRYNRHYFYDLRDILVKAGADAPELARFDEALSGCVVWKASTEYVLKGATDGFKVDSFCGLSMYLPSNGSAYLDDYYKTLDWNVATCLVK